MGDTQITDAKTRYSAGVLKYRQMGYWQPDYLPKDTDLIALFRLTPQSGVDAMRPSIDPRNASASPRHSRRSKLSLRVAKP